MSEPGQSDSRWWISSLLERVSLVQAGRKMAGRKRTALSVAALENVEKRFGNMESLVDPAVHSVATLPDGRITRSALEKLFSHQVSAVRVPNFYPVSASRKLAETFLKSKDAWGKNWKVSSSRGMESSDVDSIGTPYNVALGGGAEAVKKYFDDAELLRQQLACCLREASECCTAFASNSVSNHCYITQSEGGVYARRAHFLHC